MGELEATATTFQHSSYFYLVTCSSFPMIFVAARASRVPWPATRVALVYTAIRLLVVWGLPLFPGEPRIGPVSFRPTHMVPPDFPLLLLGPAVAVDLLQRVERAHRHWSGGILAGVTLFLAFLAVQWPFASFLASPGARNAVFAGDNFWFFLRLDSYIANHVFYPWDAFHGQHPKTALLCAMLLSVLAAQIGLFGQRWLSRLQR